MRIVCPSCGKETEGGYMFCMMCGARIGDLNPAEAVEAVEEAVKESAEAVEEAVSEVSETAETITESVEETIAESAETAGEAVEETVAETAETAEDTIEEAVEAATETVETVEEAITESFEAAEETAAETVEAAEATVAETVVAAETTAAETALAAEQILNDTVENADTVAEEAVETVKETLSEAQPVIPSVEPQPVVQPVAQAAQPQQEVQPITQTAQPVVQPVSQPVAQPVQPQQNPAVTSTPYGATVAVFPPSGTAPIQPGTQPMQNAQYEQYAQNYGQSEQLFNDPQAASGSYWQQVQAQPYNQQMQQAYVQPVYASPEYTKSPAKKKLGFGRRLLAFFFCIFLFLCGVVTVAVYGIRKSVTPENLTSAVRETSAISELNVAELTGNEADEGKSIAAYIMEQIPEEQKAAYPELTEENLNDLLNDKQVQKLISGTLGDFVDYMTGQEEDFAIDADKIVDVLKENEKTIEQYTGKKLVEADYKEIRTQIEDFNETEVPKLTEEGPSGNIADVMRYVKIFFSNGFLYILLGATALFGLLVFLACGRFVDVSLIHVGLTGAIVGGLYYGGVALGEKALEKFASEKISETYIEMLKKILFDQFGTAGLVVLCAGAGTVVIGIIWKIIRLSVSK